MRMFRRPVSPAFAAGVSLIVVLLGIASSAEGAKVVLRNGVQREGRLGKIAGLAENPLAPAPAVGGVDLKLIVLVDDDLRRTFFSTYLVQSVAETEPAALERIKINQPVARTGPRVAGVGPIVYISPWDEWGRRYIRMVTARGQENVIQGITEITPVWTKVEGLVAEKSYVWDMRIATTSIPRETLTAILKKQLDEKNPDHRLRVVRLYLQAERYEDASRELEDVLKSFPELAALRAQAQSLRQLSANRLIEEIELRRSAGQHRLAHAMLSKFPEAGVAGETLLKVRGMLDKYGETQAQGERVHRLMEEHLADIKDEALRARIAPIRDEIVAELNINTLDRMADYLRLADDDKLDAGQKLALAISGWLLGSSSGTENVAVALSLGQVRDLVRKYLGEPHPGLRQAMLAQFAGQEGYAPRYLAKLVAHMRPPRETPAQSDQVPGFYALAAPGPAGEADIPYYVQLPPEYDPYRRYPAVVTLHASGTTPQQQIEWWAGSHEESLGMRRGQATRRGYIVIAPKWTQTHQSKYEYSAREHAAVLYSLRDACRRFSIDTDRVFLSGHSMGADAAWDIALAHPDLWAGALPVVPGDDEKKYVSRYWENARHVSFYFVGGELDGNKVANNARDLDRYLTGNGFDTMVVEYLGRGHEHFQDEIQHMFEWMDLHRREFAQRKFACSSMREWDNFYWWLEVDQYPSRSMVAPVNWPPVSGVRPIVTEATVNEGNRITVRTGAAQTTLWLLPEIVNFESRLSILYNGAPMSASPEPKSEVLLEDVRTRADRLHPFWGKIELGRK
jgi:predicted esterase